MPDDPSQLRRTNWRDLCPWLILFKCLGTSLSIPLLALATAGALLVPLGSGIADLLFKPGDLLFQNPVSSEHERASLSERFLRASRWPGSAQADGYDYPDRLGEVTAMGRLGIHEFYRRFIGPWANLIAGPRSARDTAYLLFAFLWLLLIWAFFGGAIARIAVVKLGRQERVSMWDAMRHTFRKYRSYVGAPLLPLVGIVFGLLCFWLIGLLMRFNFGVLIAAFLWPFALIGAFLVTVLFLGLVFGWPFMWVALGAETDGDALDAISHAYTYALMRPLRYLGYAIVAVLVGVFGWLIVYHASEILLAFIRNSTLWAAGTERMDDLAWIFDPRNHPRPESGLLWFAGWMIRLLNGLVRTIAAGYVISYLFCAASAMYLLLRYDNENTEFDEVMVEDEEALHLPPVTQSTVAKTEQIVVTPSDSATAKPSEDAGTPPG